jgi:K+-transporting ATPase ATPase C chain
MRTIVIALRATFVTLLVTGIVYPLVATGLAQAIFPGKANGSMVGEPGQEVGSALIGQGFANPAYFYGRLSAAGKGWDGTSSGGSNMGATSAALRDRVHDDIERLEADNPDAKGPVPVELVTASASGLDPHISPEAAAWQVPRVAKMRKQDEQKILAIVNDLTEGRDLGFLGEARVNVLLLNMALDRQFGKAEPLPPPPAPAASSAAAPPAVAPAASETPSGQ